MAVSSQQPRRWLSTTSWSPVLEKCDAQRSQVAATTASSETVNSFLAPRGLGSAAVIAAASILQITRKRARSGTSMRSRAAAPHTKACTTFAPEGAVPAFHQHTKVTKHRGTRGSARCTDRPRGARPQQPSLAGERPCLSVAGAAAAMRNHFSQSPHTRVHALHL
jgi:hypothetical protein